MEKVIEFYNIIAAKAAESFFRPALKRRGYQTPEFFPCFCDLSPFSRKPSKMEQQARTRTGLTSD
jgi:hypothetical protein